MIHVLKSSIECLSLSHWDDAFEDEEFTSSAHAEGSTSSHGDSGIQIKTQPHHHFKDLHKKVGRLDACPTHLAFDFHYKHVFFVGDLNFVRQRCLQCWAEREHNMRRGVYQGQSSSTS